MTSSLTKEGNSFSDDVTALQLSNYFLITIHIFEKSFHTQSTKFPALLPNSRIITSKICETYNKAATTTARGRTFALMFEEESESEKSPRLSPVFMKKHYY